MVNVRCTSLRLLVAALLSAAIGQRTDSAELVQIKIQASAPLQPFTFEGVDHISSTLFPYGYSFNATNEVNATNATRIHGVSGIAVLPDSLTLLALCDYAQLFSGTLELNATSFELSGIDWQSQWHLLSDDVPEHTDHLDAEGLAVLPDSHVLMSAEHSSIFAFPHQQDWEVGGSLNVTLLPQTMPHHIIHGVDHRSRHNLGFESLTALPSAAGVTPAVITAIEGSLRQDDPLVRRLLEVDALSGELRREAVMTLPENDPTLFVTEVAALDARGLTGGGDLLALVRGWSNETGNDVRLYHLHAAGADDTSRCVAIFDDEANGSTSGNSSEADDGGQWRPVGSVCRLADLVVLHKELLFQWTVDQPLGGSVKVDNYEGMAILPPAAFGHESFTSLGGVPLLLVNDNNDNPLQIGTQFVMMRLKFGSPMKSGSSQRSNVMTSCLCVLVVSMLFGLSP